MRRNAKLHTDKKEKGKWLIRLPSANEWESIARSAYELSLTKTKDPVFEADLKQVYEETGRNSKGCLLMAIINDNPCENDKRYSVKAKGGIFPVHPFFPNPYVLNSIQENIPQIPSHNTF